MAELPEVETIRRQAAAELAGRTWTALAAKPSRYFRSPAGALVRRLKGAVLGKVERRGKVLLFRFRHGSTLLVHLGMTGQVLLVPPAPAAPDHRHLVASLDDGRTLVFRDPRRFGWMRLVADAELEGVRELAQLGVDPLDPALTWDRFSRDVMERGGAVKAVLMDQRVFAGIGNIYADEILFQSRIPPARRASELSPPQLKDLYHAVKGVLAASIDFGGTSFDEAYVDIHGRPGLYGGCLGVYGREGEPCGRCSTRLEHRPVAGRTSVFCPRCQK
jgi:formamidopyrimidine-DNA glycosylase